MLSCHTWKTCSSGQNVCALVMKNTAHFDPLDVKLEVEGQLQLSLVANSETLRQLVLISYKWNCVSWGRLRNMDGTIHCFNVCRSRIFKNHSVSYRSVESWNLADHFFGSLKNPLLIWWSTSRPTEVQADQDQDSMATRGDCVAWQNFQWWWLTRLYWAGDFVLGWFGWCTRLYMSALCWKNWLTEQYEGKSCV